MPARLIFLLGVLFVFMVVPSAVNLLTEWFWFGEVGYTAVFIRTLTARATLGALVLLATFALVAFNLRTALGQVTRPYMPFPGGGDIQPIVLNQRQLQLMGTGVAGLVAVFLGLFASNEWLTWLQFQQQVPFGQTDPLFGHDVAFYVFTLPFLDLLRYLAMAALILSTIGSGAAYVVSGALALDPARGLIVAEPARKHLGLLLRCSSSYWPAARIWMSPGC